MAKEYAMLSCGKHGHKLFKITDSEMAEKVLSISPDYRLCLRCGLAVKIDREPTLIKLKDTPIFPRFKYAKKIYRIKYIAYERLIKGSFSLLLGIGLIKVGGSKNTALTSVDNFIAALKPLSRYIGFNLEKNHTFSFIRDLLTPNNSRYALLVSIIFLYAFMLLIEGISLFFFQRWGEYFSAIATALFIPVEIYEIFNGFSLLKLSAFLINIFIVVYLVKESHLFGVKGGLKRYEELLYKSSYTYIFLDEFII